jgi:cyclase
MLKKRIIPCLDVKEGRVVKGIKFQNLRDSGDPVELAYRYMQEGADELVFLDITATQNQRQTLIEWVQKVSRVIQIPFTVGGGIRDLKDVEKLIHAGADKISINSMAVKNPKIIEEIAKKFGSQCVVVAVDNKKIGSLNKVFISAGSIETNWETELWCKEIQNLGAGEILLTSIDHDGEKNGYDWKLLKKITDEVTIPVIASGGAGNLNHFLEVFQKTKVTAALAASIFHYQSITIPELKSFLFEHSIPVRYAN